MHASPICMDGGHRQRTFIMCTGPINLPANCFDRKRRPRVCSTSSAWPSPHTSLSIALSTHAFSSALGSSFWLRRLRHIESRPDLRHVGIHGIRRRFCRLDTRRDMGTRGLFTVLQTKLMIKVLQTTFAELNCCWMCVYCRASLPAMHALDASCCGCYNAPYQKEIVETDATRP